MKRYEGPGIERVVITAIQPIDGQRNLLLGTTKGIKLFNKATGSYRHDTRFEALVKERIVGMKPDGHGRIWILCDKKMFLLSNNKLTSVDELIPGAGRLSDFESNLYNGGTLCWDPSRTAFGSEASNASL